MRKEENEMRMREEVLVPSLKGRKEKRKRKKEIAKTNSQARPYSDHQTKECMI
jgi:hypothetical protein